MRIITLATFLALTSLGVACSKGSSGGSSSPPATTTTSTGVSSSSNATVATTSPAVGTTTPAVGTTTPGVTPETATQLVLSATSTTQAVSACGAITLTSENASSVPTPVVNPRTVNLTSSSTTGAFYSDAACTAAVTTTSLANGASTATFYYKNTVAAAVTVTATDTTTTVAAFPPATLGLGVGVAAPVSTTVTATLSANQLAFTNAALSQAAGTCGMLTLGLGASTTGTVTAGLIVQMTTNSPGGHFYLDPGCTEPVQQATITAGASTATIYYQDQSAGTWTVIAEPIGSAVSPATQTETIIPGTPTRLVIYNSSFSSTHNSCIFVGLALENAAGTEIAATADTPLTLATSATTGKFYSDGQCRNPVTTLSIAAGDANASIWYVETTFSRDTLTINSSSGTALQPATETIQFN